MAIFILLYYPIFISRKIRVTEKSRIFHTVSWNLFQWKLWNHVQKVLRCILDLTHGNKSFSLAILLIQYLVWSPGQTNLRISLGLLTESQSVLRGVLFFWDREIDFFLASSSHCPHFWWCQWCNEPSSSSSSSNVAASAQPRHAEARAA